MRRLITMSVLLMLLGTPLGILAQQFAPIMDGMTRMEAVISKFCEATPEFTAVLQFQVFETNGTPRLQMVMDVFKTKDRMRTDVLVDSMAQMPEEHRAALQAIRLDRIGFLFRKDTKKSFLVFPGLEACQEFPMRRDILDESANRSQAVVIHKTEVGPETMHGHPCVKTLVELTETNRPPEKAYVWYASDLEGFPVRILTSRNNLIEVIDFKGVRLGKPDATFFDIPKSYVLLQETKDVFRVAKERLQGTNAPPRPNPQEGRANQ